MANHEIDWTPENVFWGYFDPARKAVATVASGDEVTIHALPACDPSDLPPEGKSTVLPAHLTAMNAHKGDRGIAPT